MLWHGRVYERGLQTSAVKHNIFPVFFHSHHWWYQANWHSVYVYTGWPGLIWTVNIKARNNDGTHLSVSYYTNMSHSVITGQQHVWFHEYNHFSDFFISQFFFAWSQGASVSKWSLRTWLEDRRRARQPRDKGRLGLQNFDNLTFWWTRLCKKKRGLRLKANRTFAALNYNFVATSYKNTIRSDKLFNLSWHLMNVHNQFMHLQFSWTNSASDKHQADLKSGLH